MLTPFPTQISGAQFLAQRENALLADDPRCGKTGAAIMAADLAFDETILIVTTASGRAVWKRAFDQWSNLGRSVAVVQKANDPVDSDVIIVSWQAIANSFIRAQLAQRRFARLILDESHYAKNFNTARTQAVFGRLINDGEELATQIAMFRDVEGVWCLTGTPLPHDPSDIYPMMRALCPERLKADPMNSYPDVMRYNDFLHRYCIVRMKKISNFHKIPVVIGGRNLDELRGRLGTFMLRRTQQDVGIRAPIYETLPLTISDKIRKEIDADLDRGAILTAADNGDTKTLEMHLGPLRRLTGEIKARAVVEAVKEEFEGGLDKIVLAYWHKDVGDVLEQGLLPYGVVRLDGSTTPDNRARVQRQFTEDQKTKVFLAQIAAAGEAIDLSASAVLLFVETTFVPSQMRQMALRITNFTQTRQCFVRVAVLEGSIDEALQESLLRLWSAIREVLE